MALIIPQKFGDEILRRESAKSASAYGRQRGKQHSHCNGVRQSNSLSPIRNSVLAESIGSASIGGINAQTRAWFNPSLKSRNYMVPGVLVMILLIATMNLTSMAVVKEKEIGTLEQLYGDADNADRVDPRKADTIYDHGLVNWCVVLTAMVVGFGSRFHGNVFLLFGLSIFFLLTSLGLGFVCLHDFNTQQQAIDDVSVFPSQPMMYIRASRSPVENMPKFLQLLRLV